jgi:hypothetical protein
MAEQTTTVTKTVELNAADKPQLLVQESEYKGHPVLNVVYMGGGFPMALKFGVGKAKMCLWAIDEIKKFYDKHQGKLANAKE